MRTLIILAALTVTAMAAPANDGGAVIVQQESDNIGVDGFRYSYQTSNGISAQEEGVLQNVGTDNEALQVRGSFSYTGDDGNVYQVTFTADERGFIPLGEHLPKSP